MVNTEVNINEKIDVVSLRELLNEPNLVIPNYQRPYRWKAEKHVKQILEDFYAEFQKKTKEYRIGTVILHKKDEILNIVDGQQRLVTLSLILYCLGEKANNPILKQEFQYADSRNNIVFNYRFIEAFIQNLNDPQGFSSYILNHCFLVKITLNEISEAFQLFDSQNARGKSLEPSNLLKAYHLRSMLDCSPEIKKELIEQWEYYEDSKLLDKVLGEYLFRLRRWTNKENDYYLTKEEIEEFKGVNIIDSIKVGRFYPFIKSTYMLSQSIHFQINEPIVNGRRFFEYMLFYIDLVSEVKNFINKNEEINKIIDYEGIHRTGDQYLLNLYENILLLYVDKFGIDEAYIQFAKELYRWVFSERVTNPRVGVGSIVKLLKQNNNPMFQITKWYSPQILMMKVSIPKMVDITTGVKNFEKILKNIRLIEGNKKDTKIDEEN